MSMHKSTRIPRIAARVCESLQCRSRCLTQTDFLWQLLNLMPEFQRASARYRISQNRGWSAAEQHTRRELSHCATRLEEAASRLVAHLRIQPSEAPSFRAILEELLEIDVEFGKVRLDSDANAICVQTEPITLDHIELGRFEIQLHLGAIAAIDESNCLRVLALDPNPCAADELIVHPHVSDDRLCLGDATGPLQAALRQCRFADAFQIAAAVLRTYNDGSPYCTLDVWHGRTCEDCGVVSHDDNSYFCEHCEQHFCDECYSGCVVCHESSCASCLASCEMCDERVCCSCLQSCSHCGESACASCLEEELCQSCLEEVNEEEIEDDEEEIQEQSINQQIGSPGERIHVPSPHNATAATEALSSVV
ncbi:MAG TPA: hypothetical protein PKN33_18760 [Phycisphaerae bacterium]|nr:hypothetical protein [Phycisphaerae bacterium]